MHYLGTPLRYRWMGITPTLPLALARLQRPDVVHVFGFRDPVTTGDGGVVPPARGSRTSSSRSACSSRRLRKVALKRALDATLYRGVARGAAAVVVASERERDDVVACGVPRGEGARARQRLSGAGRRQRANGDLRAQLGIPRDAPLVLYVGRIASGKGIDHLLAAVRELPEAHLVIAGPDDRHGVSTRGRARAHAADDGGAAARVSIRRRTSSCSPRPARASAWSRPRPPRPARR